MKIQAIWNRWSLKYEGFKVGKSCPTYHFEGATHICSIVEKEIFSDMSIEISEAEESLASGRYPSSDLNWDWQKKQTRVCGHQRFFVSQ